MRSISKGLKGWRSRIGAAMKTYILEASVEHEEDGRWSAWIEALPGCATWGYTKEEALTTLREAARLYIEDMIEAGHQIPESITVTEAPVLTVSV
jgi:predicted RNase H-like HicB family nuclease